MIRKDDIIPLGEIVRAATWEDAKSSFTSSSLVGPPSLEFAMYKKIPGSKKRTDARQGTIDQDPEFMAFLEDLANPAPMKQALDTEDGDDAVKAEIKITSTPLIEFLKEKKANKVKEAAASKSAKHSRQEAANGKSKSTHKDDDGSRRKGKEIKSSKLEKSASKETVKILTKRAATEQASEAAKTVAGQISSTNAPAKTTHSGSDANPTKANGSSALSGSTTSTSDPVSKNRRAGIAAAARLLQRDLGLSPGSAHRRARQDAAKADPDPKSTTNQKDTPTTNEKAALPTPSIETVVSQPSKNQTVAATNPKSQPGRRNRGGKNIDKAKVSEGALAQTSAPAPPVILKKKGDSDMTQAATEAASNLSTTQQSHTTKATTNTHNTHAPKGGSNKPSQRKGAAVSHGALRGFVKHANPSQGVTEAALKQALEAFGVITFVEMDKRKGFAYVDFAEHSGLVKAVSASPIPVAQATVQVLERKDKKPGAATAPAASANGTPNAVSTTAPSTNSTAPDKGSGQGRGRRGRGGGGGGGAKGNATTNGGHAPVAIKANSGGTG